ncbi:MAG: response regulator transcription factor [Gammaproteobacteria bacterium]|nr:response regulator transcription factor [Gammaproteobacteria bacterium]
MEVTDSSGEPKATADAGERCRVLLVDDHEILLKGLRALLELESDLEIVAEATSVEAALQAIDRDHPNLVMTDLAMPGRSGLELVAILREQHPEIRVVVLTAHDDKEYIHASLSGGARGYVLKDANRVELLRAIRAVHRGNQFLCQAVVQQVVTDFIRNADVKPSASTALRPVTRREQDVLTRIASGQHNKKIAYELGLSVATVHKHAYNIKRKLGLSSIAGMTAYAIQKGFLPPAGAPGGGES